MEQIKVLIERKLEDLSHMIFQYRFIVLALLILPSIGLIVTQLPKLKTDTSVDGFLLESDPAIINYKEFKNQFGRDDLIIVGIKTPDVFERNFLEKLRSLHRTLEEKVPHLIEVKSLINARSTRGEDDMLIVEELMEDWPVELVDFEKKRKIATRNPLYRNLYISSKGTFTVLTIELDTRSELNEVDLNENYSASLDQKDGKELSRKEIFKTIGTIKKILLGYEADGFPVFLAGSPVSTGEVAVIIQKDMKLLTGVCLLTIVFFLALFFKNLFSVFLPLFVVILSLLTTFSLMAFFGIPIKTPTTILPNFILAVGVSGAVHILSSFSQHYRKTRDKKKSTAKALSHSGLPVIITSLTTVAGVFSFTAVDVAPVVDVGIFASVGVLFSLVFSLLLIPALLAVLPFKVGKVAMKKSKSDLLDKLNHCIGVFAVDHYRVIITIAVLMSVVALVGAFKIEFSHNSLKWLPEKSEIRQDIETVEKEMEGAVTLEIIIDTGKENGLYDYKVLKGIEKMANFMKSENEKLKVVVSQTISLVDILKETHRALNKNKDVYFSIPEGADTIAQEFLLFENSGSDNLKKVVDSQFRIARFTVKVPIVNAISYIHFISVVKKEMESVFGNDVKIIFTGYMSLLAKTYCQYQRSY